MFNSKFLRNSSCFVLSSSLISTVQYSAGFAINQNLEDTTTSFDGRNSAEGVSSANKSVVVDNIKLVPNILLKVLKWGLIAGLFFILLFLSLGVGGALYVCSRYLKGDSSCFRKLVEVAKIYFVFLRTDVDIKNLEFKRLSSTSEAKFESYENRKKLSKHLFDNFSDIFNTENFVNDLINSGNEIATKTLVYLFDLCFFTMSESKSEKFGRLNSMAWVLEVREGVVKGEISAEKVNDKLKKLGEKFTLGDFLAVLLGIDPPLLVAKMQNQGKLDLPKNSLNAN